MKKTPAPDILSIELARERSHEAASRTLMAWIRTALSLIGFGFGVDRMIHFMAGQGADKATNPVAEGRFFGMSFVLLGTFGLLAAVFQHWHVLIRIKRADYVYHPPWPITEIVAALLLLIGFYMIVTMLI